MSMIVAVSRYNQLSSSFLLMLQRGKKCQLSNLRQQQVTTTSSRLLVLLVSNHTQTIDSNHHNALYCTTSQLQYSFQKQVNNTTNKLSIYNNHPIRNVSKISSSPKKSTIHRALKSTIPKGSNPTTSTSSFMNGSMLPVLPIPSIENIPQPLIETRPKGFRRRLIDQYSLTGQQNRILRAEAYFQAATRQASNPEWFGPGGIGREFRPRHALLTMHIWFLHKRLIADELDKDMSLMVQEELFDILWNDTTSRIRQLGIHELSVNKSLNQVQQYTFLHLTSYDEIYTKFLDKPVERLAELRKLIHAHIFVRAENGIANRYDHLDRLAWYIDCNYQNMMLHMPYEYFKEGRIAWTTLPDFSNIRDTDGTILPSTPIYPDDVVPEPWVRNITIEGEDYYWNPITNESTWEKPTSSSLSANVSEK